MKEAITALLVIDAQQGLLEGENAVPDAAIVTDRIVQLLTAARSAGTLVVHLQNDGAPGSLDEPETPGWFIHPRLSPEEGEIVLRKTGDDGFEGTELQAILARHDVNCMAVAGLLSEMCVSATIRGALVRRLKVVLVRDAHATYPLDDISAAVVSRVAEHALGDEIELLDTSLVAFERPGA